MTLHRAEPAVRRLPQDHGPDRVRARELRRRRELAHEAGRRWRHADRREGELFDGQQVDGPVGLRTALLRYSPQFVRMFIEKMMTYALGRGVEYTDMPTIRAIARDAGEGQQPVLGDRARSGEEPAVPDAGEEAKETGAAGPRGVGGSCLGPEPCIDVCHQEAHSPSDVPARRRRHAGAAAARVDAAGADAVAADGRGAGPRFVGIWHPHGAAPGYWSPLQEGADFEFSFITKPLEPFRDRVVLITGLDMPEAMATDDEPGGDHARGAVLLSGARPRRNAVSPFLGVTIDQLIASKYGQDTILSSLQLGVEDTGNFGNCNWGYSCAYTNSISWSSPTQPLPTQVNPRVVFERLFGDGTSPEERPRDRQRTPASSTRSSASSARSRAVSAPATRRASTPTWTTSASSNGASRSRWRTR